MKKFAFLLMAVSTLAISGCGQTRGERTASGAIIGAGAGAVGNTLIGGSPWTGAAIGGAGGAAVGAMSD